MKVVHCADKNSIFPRDLCIRCGLTKMLMSYDTTRHVPSRPICTAKIFALHHTPTIATSRRRTQREKEFARNTRSETQPRNGGEGWSLMMWEGVFNGSLHRDAYPVAPRACTQNFTAVYFSPCVWVFVFFSLSPSLESSALIRHSMRRGKQV